MTETVPTPETMQRIDRVGHFLNWIVSRLSGSIQEKETAITMLGAQLKARYIDGIRDAGDLANDLAAVKPSSHDLAVLVEAIRKLERLNQDDPEVTI